MKKRKESTRNFVPSPSSDGDRRCRSLDDFSSSPETEDSLDERRGRFLRSSLESKHPSIE